MQYFFISISFLLFFLHRKHILLLLLILELVVILLFFILFSYFLNFNSIWMVLYFLVIIITDGVLGLCCMISLLRSNYSDKSVDLLI